MCKQLLRAWSLHATRNMHDTKCTCFQAHSNIKPGAFMSTRNKIDRAHSFTHTHTRTHAHTHTVMVHAHTARTQTACVTDTHIEAHSLTWSTTEQKSNSNSAAGLECIAPARCAAVLITTARDFWSQLHIPSQVKKSGLF